MSKGSLVGGAIGTILAILIVLVTPQTIWGAAIIGFLCGFFFSLAGAILGEGKWTHTN